MKFKMMKSAFTLIELLVVVAIMGLMGTASVGGYRQMQRGMEERRVVDDASKFLAVAAERAQIERQPVVVYYWNEMLRSGDDDVDTEVVVGKAVAVRRCGRLTRVYRGNPFLLIDEFGDMEQYDGEGGYVENPADDSGKKVQQQRLYNLDTVDASERYSLVSRPQMVKQTLEAFMSSDALTANGGLSAEEGANGALMEFGYKVESANGVTWKVGSLYGLEFQSIQLPHGYLFGNQVPTGIGNPVSKSKVVQFNPDTSGNMPSGSIDVYVLRQGRSGNLEPMAVNTARSTD